MMSMSEAPRDGTSIILYYRVRAYKHGEWEWDGHKWEQARYIDGHWEPWCGNWRTRSTLHITEGAAEGWIPGPLELPNYFVTEFYHKQKDKETQLVRVELASYPEWVLSLWQDLQSPHGAS